LPYFLQEYLGFTPSCSTALERGVPGLKSFFLLLYERTVMLNADDDRGVLPYSTENPVTTRHESAHKRAEMIRVDVAMKRFISPSEYLF
jgi:hypothetical protein